MKLTITAQSFENRPDGDFYLGDLDSGKAIAHEERLIYEGPVTGSPGDHYLVAFCDEESADLEEAWRNCAEWGCSESGNTEEAWRYALGALLGPYDYDEESFTLTFGCDAE